MRKFLSVLIVLLLTVALVGCGDKSPGSEKNEASSTEKQGTTEPQGQVEAETQEQVDEVPLADGFPEEVPVIEGIITQSEKTDTISLKDGSKTGEAYVTLITTPKTVSEAAEFYKSKFTQIKNEMDGDSPSFNGVIGNYDVDIYIGTVEGQTEVHLQVNMPK